MSSPTRSARAAVLPHWVLALLFALSFPLPGVVGSAEAQAQGKSSKSGKSARSAKAGKNKRGKNKKKTEAGPVGQNKGQEVGAAAAPRAAIELDQPVPPNGPPDALVALVKPRVRKIGVPTFQGKSAESMRQAVLEVLSAHTDIELIGHDDLEFVAKRLQADPADGAGRTKLAGEMKLYGWVVADGDDGRLSVVDARNKTLGTLKLDPKQRADVQVQERLWNELGRFMSDEGLRNYTVLRARERAIEKLQGQGVELARQHAHAEQREKRQAEQLAALKQHASRRLAAQNEELLRQSKIAGERAAAQRAAAAKQIEIARKNAAAAAAAAAAARQAQAQPQPAHPQQPAYGAQPGAYGYGAAVQPGGYGAGTPPAGAYGAAPQPGGGYGTTALPGGAYGTAAQPAAGAQPAGGYGAQPAYGSAGAQPGGYGYGAQPGATQAGSYGAQPAPAGGSAPATNFPGGYRFGQRTAPQQAGGAQPPPDPGVQGGDAPQAAP